MFKRGSIRKLCALLLALALAAGCAGPTDIIKESGAVPAMAESLTTTAPPETSHADVDYRDMTWEVYDMEPFRAMAEELSRTENGAEAEELYRSLTEEYVRLRTYSQLAWIDFYASRDPAGSVGDACQALDADLTEAWDLIQSAAGEALTSEDAGEFSDYLGGDLAEELLDYEEMTDREAELWDRETALVREYNALMGDGDLSEEALNQQLGELLMDLVEVRNQLADLNGYESYAAFAYEMTYGRDYTPEDAAALCQAVKPYARAYYADSYYSGIFWENVRSFSAGELMDLLETYAPRISPQAAQAQAYMEDHGLYLLESAEEVTDMGFTTLLPMYNAPFLYNSLTWTVYDVTGTFHEFGHYYDAYVNPEPDPVNSVGSFDIFEIHSTGMEALLYGWLEEIYGRDAPIARAWTLDSLLGNVFSGCLFDEFLQYVYAHPELTPAELNRTYGDIAASYGMEMYRDEDAYGWMYVSHNFESPFYYISYAVSTLASLQLWAMAQEDREGAVALYNDLVAQGAFDQGYCQLLESLDMTLFTQDLDSCLRPACDALAALCMEYDRGGLAA